MPDRLPPSTPAALSWGMNEVGGPPRRLGPPYGRWAAGLVGWWLLVNAALLAMDGGRLLAEVKRVQAHSAIAYLAAVPLVVTDPKAFLVAPLLVPVAMKFVAAGDFVVAGTALVLGLPLALYAHWPRRRFAPRNGPRHA